MTGEMDPNAITADVLTQLIKNAFSSITQNSSASIRSAWQKVFEDFEPYAQQTHKKTSFVRILCDKKNDIPLYDVYVGGSFSSNHEHVSDESLVTYIMESHNVIINGSGGAGKTFFMKHLWQTIFRHPRGVLPVFIDLRNLNEIKTSLDIKSFLRITIGSKGHLPEDLFDYFLINGRFCFILDGFDELRDDIREGVQSQTLSLSEKFPKCSLVVSSRQHQRFAGWQGFKVFDSDPFPYEKVTELIEKIPFNLEYKKTFQKHLTKDFYEQHKHFLSNPLLCVMMLMTFKEHMAIPKNMNVFYDQAFNTLFVWHDATKAFSREKSMDIDEFRKSFGVFCLLSYYNQVHEFSAVQLMEYIRMSNKVIGWDKKDIDIKKDYVESVNMLQEEGLGYIFIHRSFQEYFAAYAMMNVVGSKMIDFIRAFKSRPADNVMPIAYEMDKTTIIENYIMPEFNASLKKISRRVLSKAPYRQFREVGLRIEQVNGGLKANKKKKRFGSRGYEVYFMIDLDQDIRNFVNTVYRIIDKGIKYDFEDVLYDIPRKALLHYNIPQGGHYNFSGSFTFVLTFEDAKWSIAAPDIADVPPEVVDGLRNELEQSLIKNEPEILAVSSEFKRRLDIAREWCEGQIKENKSRNKSLNDILGFGTS